MVVALRSEATRSNKARYLGVAVVCVLCLQCSRSPTQPTPGPTPPGPGPSPTPTVPASGPAVFVGAGDIAIENGKDDTTARLLESIGGDIFTLGDNAYPNGSPENFRDQPSNPCGAESRTGGDARACPQRQPRMNRP